MEEKFNLYDSINTMATRWLTYQQRIGCKPLGIYKFNSKDENHLWFLHILENYRVFNNYNFYYIDCSLREYFYIRFIKKFKGARRSKNKNITLIKVDIFIEELIASFKEVVPDISTAIIGEIYAEYWRR